MSYGSVDLVMRRIKGAASDSPIAVFKCDKPGQLQAFFARTVVTAGLIKTSPDLVGVFSGADDLNAVKLQLSRAVVVGW